MKKKKQDKAKALTANERKELRRKELEKEQAKAGGSKIKDTKEVEQENTNLADINSEVDFVENNDLGGVESNDDLNNMSVVAYNNSGATVVNPSSIRSKLWLIITAGVLAIVAITMGIVIPTAIVPTQAYRHINNPVVAFTLSSRDPETGRAERIAIEIYEEAVPNVATNFLHLARIGFFNDTIIFDNNNRFVRFGQFEDNTFRSFRTTNQNFLNGLNSRQLPTLPEQHAANVAFSPFDFRITQDTGAAATTNNLRNTFNERGVLSSIPQTGLGGTEFQIATITAGNPAAQIVQQTNRATGVTRTQNMTGRFIGRVTEDTFPVLDRIAALANDRNSPHPFFNPPVDNSISNRGANGNIYIVSTRLYNMDFWGKWRTFSWDEHFLGQSPARITWHNGTSWNAVRDVRQLTPIAA